MIAAYAAAYRFTPRRFSYIGLDLEHTRQFAHRWELYFYYPAGWVESRLIRAWPGLYNHYVECPQIVVLIVFEHRNNFDSTPYSFRFHSGPVPPPIEEIFPAKNDILEYVAEKNPGHGRSFPNGVSENDGQTTICKYYSCNLDRAETYLSTKYPRPWTLEKVLGWFKDEREPEARRDLAYLLGATHDPRAALALGESLEDEKLKIQDMVGAGAAAYYELLNFIPMPKCQDEPPIYPGGIQRRGTGYQEEWFRANKARLRKISDSLKG